MKAVFTILIGGIYIASMAGQITITTNDMPLPNSLYNYDEITEKNPVAPTLGGNQNWNYSALFGNKPTSTPYIAEEDPFYTNLGVDVYTTGFKNLNQQLGYNIYTEIDFNTDGVDDVGIYVEPQTYSLETLTGNSADNITFPLQGYIFTKPRRIIKFPMTANSAWESQSRRITNFTIKVAAYGLNNVPASILYNTIRKDTIVGWGTLRVYTPAGPSIPYEVLVDKTQQFNIDSFYLNGAPAPALLLNAFSITQGQRTGVTNHYNFYRKGTFSYLLRLNYGSDNTFKKLENAYFNTDNLSSVSSANNIIEKSYNTILFPNPAVENEINLVFNGVNINQVSYKVTDMSGKTVQKIDAMSLQGNILTVNLDNLSSAGMYNIEVRDKDYNIIAVESFIYKKCN